VRIPLTDKEKQISWNQGREWKQKDEPSQELILRIESYLEAGERKEWRDRTKARLEDRINEVAQGLLTAMVLVEDHEQRRRDEEQRRWKLEQERPERERRRKIEEARWKQVVELAESALQVKMVREFLDTLEQRALAAAGDQGLSAKIQNWFAWARRRADVVDPVLNSQEFLASENVSLDDRPRLRRIYDHR